MAVDATWIVGVTSDENTLNRTRAPAPLASAPTQPVERGAERRGGSRIISFDVLRAVAAIAVIYIHTSSDTLHNMSAVNTPAWRLALALHVLSRWCVPIYVMISGAFVLGYRERYTTRDFYSKRMVKVLIPFLAWTAIYLLWRASTGQIALHSLSDVVANTVSKPAAYHLWFFYMILGLYLVTPALSILISRASRPLLWTLTALCLWEGLSALLFRFTGVRVYMGLPVVSGYVGYYLLGWLLKTSRKPSLPTRVTLYLLGAVSVVVIWTATAALTTANGRLEESLLAYTGPLVVLESVAIFVVAQSIDWSRLFRARIGRAALQALNALALATFGIYLIHLIVKYYVQQYTGAMMPVNSLEYVIFAALLIYVVSAAIIVVTRKIPVLAWLAP